MIDFDEIAEMGEESGRDEAADDYPFLPRNPDRRVLKWYGRGRAQGLYELRGKAARVFARQWAMGYEANIDMWKRDGLLPDEDEQESEEEQA